MAITGVAAACTQPGTTAAPAVTTTTTPSTTTSTTVVNYGPDCVPFTPHDNAAIGIGCDLSNRVLTDIVLSNTYMPETNFNGSTLVRVDLGGSNVKYSHFRGTTFDGSDLAGATFPDSDFTDSVFDGDPTDLRGSWLSGSTFTGSTMTTTPLLDDTTMCPDAAYWDAVDGCRGSLAGL